MSPSVEPDQEVVRPSRPFPNFKDFGKEIREVLSEVDGELFSEPMGAERKKAYRIKTASEVKAPIPMPIISQPSVSNRVHFEETTSSTNVRNPIYQPELSFSSHALVQGIIMSEILQPPRAKRPFRH